VEERDIQRDEEVRDEIPPDLPGPPLVPVGPAHDTHESHDEDEDEERRDETSGDGTQN
jgi:hypothetical protein